MITVITILIIIASVFLALFILVQSPKGGGLAGNFGSLSTQVMGVKQSTDVMEKGTWIFMGAIAALCLATIMFVEKPNRPASEQPARQQSGAPALAAPSAQPANQPAPQQ